MLFYLVVLWNNMWVGSGVLKHTGSGRKKTKIVFKNK